MKPRNNITPKTSAKSERDSLNKQWVVSKWEILLSKLTTTLQLIWTLIRVAVGVHVKRFPLTTIWLLSFFCLTRTKTYSLVYGFLSKVRYAVIHGIPCLITVAPEQSWPLGLRFLNFFPHPLSMLWKPNIWSPLRNISCLILSPKDPEATIMGANDTIIAWRIILL